MKTGQKNSYKSLKSISINGKEYIEVHSFTTKTQYFVTNIEWD